LTALCRSEQADVATVHALPFHFSHAPAPLHLPSFPHVELAATGHKPCGSSTPTPTARQTPS
jgi:hypothetical protein